MPAYLKSPIFAAVMKKVTIWGGVAITLLSLGACNNKEEVKPKQLPKPGTTVASAEMAVTDDPLNHFKFSVKVIADSNIAKGVYDVDVDYGPNFSEGQFSMPKGAEELVPVIKKGKMPSTFIIGFYVPGDTTFYDYFEVSGNIRQTKMQYVKAYTF